MDILILKNSMMQELKEINQQISLLKDYGKIDENVEQSIIIFLKKMFVNYNKPIDISYFLELNTW